MAFTTYIVKLPFEIFRFSADLTQASATIYTIDGEGERSATQFQTADARHDSRQALRLALLSCGAEYYANPLSEKSADAQLEELVSFASIR